MEKALSAYDRSIGLKSDFAEAYVHRGVTKAQQGDHVSALKDYNQAIQLKSNFAEAYDNRGIAKVQLDDIKSAKVDFQIEWNFPNNKAMKLSKLI